jgi:sugar phosphate isomerase/epimerase
VVHAGAYPFFMKEREVRIMLLERLRELCEYAEKFNTKLAIENVPHSQGLIIPYGAKLKEIKYLLDRIPKLMFVLDVPHLLFSGDNEIVIDRVHMERMICLHLHDTDGFSDHIEIGKGIIDHEDVLKNVLSEKEDLLINAEVVGINEMRRSIKKIKKIVKKIKSQ